MFVQVASAEEFAANVKSAGGSCELYIYEGAGHAFLNDPDSKLSEHETAIYHPANALIDMHTRVAKIVSSCIHIYEIVSEAIMHIVGDIVCMYVPLHYQAGIAFCDTQNLSECTILPFSIHPVAANGRCYTHQRWTNRSLYSASVGVY